MAADPLLGQRAAVNAGRIEALSWPDFGAGCPVKTGQVFDLRFGQITITRCRRLRRGRDFVWVADFDRSFRASPALILARGAGNGHGYTSSAEGALRADDVHRDGLLGGEPEYAPEPEAVPPHEIATYTGSQVARNRFEQQQSAARQALDALPIARRLELVHRTGADIGHELKAIARQLRRAEIKAGLRRP